MKTYIFDFDNTLYLWELNVHRRLDYTQRVSDWLIKLKNGGATLFIVSYSHEVHDDAKRFGYSSFFDEIVHRPKQTKTQMINDLLNRHDIPQKDVVFFDDDADAVEQVRSLGIHSVNVSRRQGLAHWLSVTI